LIARAVVFDLHEDRSVVRTLQSHGLDVYLVDWGAPGPDDADIGLEDFVTDWLPRAIAETCAHAGSGQVSLFGYCLGGLFCLWALGGAEPLPVRSLVMVASPVDASRMGMLHRVSQTFAPPPRWARRFGNVRGWMSQVGFWAVAPVAQTKRWTDLVARADDDRYVDQFAAMNAWLGDFADFPSRAFWQLARHHVARNRPARGRFRLAGRFVELMRVRVPVLAFAGDRDRVVLPASVEAISDLVASEDVTVVRAPGGHAGVMGGSRAAKAVWEPAARFLVDRGAAVSVDAA
jgi:polyhydroxyalkanoate synthase